MPVHGRADSKKKKKSSTEGAGDAQPTNENELEPKRVVGVEMKVKVCTSHGYWFLCYARYLNPRTLHTTKVSAPVSLSSDPVLHTGRREGYKRRVVGQLSAATEVFYCTRYVRQAL